MIRDYVKFTDPPPPQLWSSGGSGGMWAQWGGGEVCQAVLGSTEVYIETTYVPVFISFECTH